MPPITPASPCFSAHPPTPTPTLSPRTRWLLSILAVLALLISLYLTWTALSLQPVLGCGPGSSCAQVLSSRWSRWLDLPVSAPASAAYLLALAALFHLRPLASARQHRQAWFILLTLAVAIFTTALWFLALQAFVLRSFCNWCLAAHALGLVWSVLILFHCFRLHAACRRRNEPPVLSSFWRNTALALGLSSTTALVAGQIVFPPRTFLAYRDPAAALTGSGSERILTLLGGRVILRPHSLPVIGSPDAPHLIVLLTDYTCPNCRIMHQFLHQALARYPDQLALVLVHIPMDHRCNDMFEPSPESSDQPSACELARLALAFWKTAPDRFPDFDTWLMDPQTWSSPAPLDLETARRRAAELLGSPDRLAQALADPWPDEQLRRNVGLARLIRMRRLPMLFLGTTIVEGRPAQADELLRLIESEFRLSPPP